MAVRFAAGAIRGAVERVAENYGRGKPPDVNENEVRSTRLQVNTTEVIDENGQIVRRVDVRGTYSDRTGAGVDSELEEFIEERWSGSFVDSEGIRYELTTDIEKLGADYASQLRGPDIVFQRGSCSTNYACASHVTGKLTIQNLREFMTDGTGIAHEFGHILGFHHFNNGNGNVMSYDTVGRVQQRQIDLLWNKYNLD